MLVYANSFRINLPKNELNSFWKAIDYWLTNKTKGRLRPSNLINKPPATAPDGSSLEVMFVHDPREDGRDLVSATYAHPDHSVDGRYWITRIGLRSDPAHECAEVTIVTETNETSVQSGMARVFTSRPSVVLNIIQQCGLIDDMVTKNVQTLRLKDIEYFQAELDSPSRDYAIVLISPDPFREIPSVEPKEVLKQVIGLANVVVIPDKREAKSIANIIGKKRAAWNGSINIIYPHQKSGYTPTHVLLQSQLKLLQDEGIALPQHFLHLLTHRLNLTHSRNEITPHHVQQLALELRLETLEAKARVLQQVEIESLSRSEQLKAYVHTIKQKDEIIDTIKQSLVEKEKEVAKERENAEKNLGHWLEAQEQLEEIPKLRAEIASYKAAFVERKGAESHVEQIPTCVSEAIQIAELKFSEFLEFGFNSKSEHKNSLFQKAEEVLQALAWLATRYQPSRIQGGIVDLDADLRNLIPGWSYSGHQSEATMKADEEWYRCPSRNRRGIKFWLEEHIKYGTSRRAEETLRIAFAWDADRQKVIIGFIGQHQKNTKS